MINDAGNYLLFIAIIYFRKLLRWHFAFGKKTLSNRQLTIMISF